jgi:hypothetical protein
MIVIVVPKKAVTRTSVIRRRMFSDVPPALAAKAIDGLHQYVFHRTIHEQALRMGRAH